MERITLEELEQAKDWEEAVIVFKNESFGGIKEYPLDERSYSVKSSAKFFDPNMIGNSLYGNCLDGKDLGVRLDWYMSLTPAEGRRWEVEYCYIVK